MTDSYNAVVEDEERRRRERLTGSALTPDAMEALDELAGRRSALQEPRGIPGYIGRRPAPMPNWIPRTVEERTRFDGEMNSWRYAQSQEMRARLNLSIPADKSADSVARMRRNMELYGSSAMSMDLEENQRRVQAVIGSPTLRDFYADDTNAMLAQDDVRPLSFFQIVGDLFRVSNTAGDFSQRGATAQFGAENRTSANMQRHLARGVRRSYIASLAERENVESALDQEASMADGAPLTRQLGNMVYRNSRVGDEYRPLTAEEQYELNAWRHDEIMGLTTAAEMSNNFGGWFLENIVPTAQGLAEIPGGAMRGGRIAWERASRNWDMANEGTAADVMERINAVIGFAPDLVVDTGFGAITGPIAFTYQQEAGNAYLEYTQHVNAEGDFMDRRIAGAYARDVGSINSIFEIANLSIIGKFLGAGKIGGYLASAGVRSAFRRYALNEGLRRMAVGIGGTALTEGSTEMLQETSVIALGEMARLADSGMFDMLSPQEIAERLFDVVTANSGRIFEAGVAGAVIGGGIATVVAPITIGSMIEDARVGKEQQQLWNAIEQQSGNSKLRERAPSVYQKLTQRLLQGTPLEQVAINVEDFIGAFNQDVDQARAAARELTGVGVAAFDAAKQTGGDIFIPASTMHSQIANTAEYKHIAEHVKIGPEVSSIAEVKARLENGLDVKRAIEAGTKLQDQLTALEEAKAKVRQEFIDRLQASETWSQDEFNGALAELFAEGYFTIAKAAGVDPSKLPAIPTIIGPFGQRKLTQAEIDVGGFVTQDEDMSKTARGATQFERSIDSFITGAKIAFTETRNASTAPHEIFGHYFLELLRFAASQESATPILKEDWQTTLSWLDMTNERWEAALKLQPKAAAAALAPAHEKFARAVEVYFQQGRAPTPRLKRVFRMFKLWLTRAFRDMKRLGPDGEITHPLYRELMDDRIRPVLDRMFASQESIAEYAELMGSDEIMSREEWSAVGNKFADAAYERYTTRIVDARRRAEEAIDAAAIAVLVKENTKERRRAELRARRTVEAEMAQSPEWIAHDVITGRFELPQAQGIRLNSALVFEEYGADTHSAMPTGSFDTDIEGLITMALEAKKVREPLRLSARVRQLGIHDATGQIEALQGNKKGLRKASEGMPVSQAIQTLWNEGWFGERNASENYFQPDRPLIAVHNISEKKLMHSIQMGGIAVPSLAIIRADYGFDNFGEISLIASPALIDPNKNRSARVFNADVYSPRYPTVRHSVSDKIFRSLIEREPFQRASKDLGFKMSSELDESELTQNGINAVIRSTVVQLAYARMNGIDVELPMEKDYKGNDHVDYWSVRRTLQKTIENDATFVTWARAEFSPAFTGERIYLGYTDSGRQSYLPHTLDNVVRVMKRKLRDGEGFNYGVGSIRSMAARQFRTITGIKGARDQIVTAEVMKAVKEEADQEFWALAEQLRPKTHFTERDFGWGDAFSEHLKDVARTGRMSSIFEYYREQPSEADQVAIAEFLEKLRNLPTEYFEAKIQRAVALSEFSAAVVPEDIDVAVIDALAAAGITDIRTYKNPEERQAALMSGSQDLYFQDEPSTAKVRSIETVARDGKAVSIIVNPSKSKLMSMTAVPFYDRAEPWKYDTLRYVRDAAGNMYVAPAKLLHDDMVKALSEKGIQIEGYLMETQANEGHGSTAKTGWIRRDQDQLIYSETFGETYQQDIDIHPTALRFGSESEIRDLLDIVNSGADLNKILAHPLLVRVQEHASSLEQTLPADRFDDPNALNDFEYVVNGQPATYEEMLADALNVARSYAEVRSERVATMVIGNFAAGKSTFIKQLAEGTHAAVVDADQVKSYIPIYEDGYNTAATKNESAFIRWKVRDALMTAGNNIVIEHVGQQPDAVLKSKEDLERDGYTVTVVHVRVEADEATRRSTRRFIQGGRYIELKDTRKVVEPGLVAAAFETLVEKKALQAYVEIDATPPPRQAILIRAESGERQIQAVGSSIGSIARLGQASQAQAPQVEDRFFQDDVAQMFEARRYEMVQRILNDVALDEAHARDVYAGLLADHNAKAMRAMRLALGLEVTAAGKRKELLSEAQVEAVISQQTIMSVVEQMASKYGESVVAGVGAPITLEMQDVVISTSELETTLRSRVRELADWKVSRPDTDEMSDQVIADLTDEIQALETEIQRRTARRAVGSWEPTGISALGQATDEEVLDWYHNSGEVRVTAQPSGDPVIYFKTDPALKTFNARLTMDEDALRVGEFSATTHYQGRVNNRDFDGNKKKPTRRQLQTARSFFLRMALVTRAFVLTNKPVSIEFTGGSLSHDKLYASMLRLLDFSGYTARISREIAGTLHFKEDSGRNYVFETLTFFLLRPDIAAARPPKLIPPTATSERPGISYIMEANHQPGEGFRRRAGNLIWFAEESNDVRNSTGAAPTRDPAASNYFKGGNPGAVRFVPIDVGLDDVLSIRAIPAKERAVRALDEAEGWFYQEEDAPSEGEFLDALRDDLSGSQRRYRASDTNAALDWDEAQKVRAFFARRGIDIAVKNDELRKQIELNASRLDDRGLDADTLASIVNAHLGYSAFGSGKEMIEAVTRLPKRSDYIKDRVDQLVRGELGDPAEDMPSAASLAMHNPDEEQRLLMELEATKEAAGTGYSRAINKTARDYAERRIAMMSVKQISAPDWFLNTERRWAKAAMEASRKKDASGANKAKFNQLVNFHLYKLARAAKTEMERTQIYFRRLQKLSARARISADYYEQIEALLDQYELRNVSNAEINRRISLTEWVKSMEDRGLGHMVQIDPDVIARAERKPFSQLTVEDARALRDAIRNIEHLGKLKDRLLNAAEKRNFENLLGDLIGQMEETGPVDPKQTRNYSEDDRQQLAGRLRKWNAALTRMEFLFRYIDGKHNGELWSALFLPFAKAADKESAYQHRVAAQLSALWERYSSSERASMFKTRIQIPELAVDSDVTGLNDTFTRMELIAIALNTGNSGNVAALVDGFSWFAAPAGLETDYVEARKKIIAVLDKHMTKRDWEFVQETWGIIGQFRDEAFDLQERLTGLRPEIVEAEPVASKHGTFAGGYYPLKFDPLRDAVVEKREAKENAPIANWGVSSLAPMTKKGHTIDRKGSGGRPVRLDFAVATDHVQNVVHDIAYREALIDVNRIVSDGRFRAAFIRTVGKEQYAQLHPWLHSIAVEYRDPTSDIGKFMQKMRGNMQVVTMGVKFATATQQVAGVLQAMPMLGGPEMAIGVAKLLGNPFLLREKAEWIMGKSEFMRTRVRSYNRDVREFLRRVQDDTLVHKTQRNAFALVGAMDWAVSSTVWITAYEKARAGKVKGIDGGVEEDAVRFADSIVRQTQSAGLNQDLPLVMRNTEMEKLITAFYSYFSVLYNWTAYDQILGARKGRVPLYMVAGNFFLIYVLAPLMTEWLAGRWDKDGEDDEERLQRMLGVVAKSPFSSVPIMRDVAGTFNSFYEYSLTPFEGGVQSVVDTAEDIASGDILSNEHAQKNAAFAVGFVFGLPTAQAYITGDYLRDYVEGEEEGLDLTEALLRDTR